jgi:hypothetical protein
MSEFRLPERLVTLDLDDPDMEGVEVVCNAAIPLRAFNQVAALLNEDESKFIEKAAELFVKWGLRSWNICDADGKPVPFEDADLLPVLFLVRIVKAWMAECGTVPRPLGLPPADGQGSEAPQE